MDSDDIEDILETAPCGYASVDPDGLIAQINRTFAMWAGVERSELIGSRFSGSLHIASSIYYETHLVPLLRIQGFVNEVALDFSFVGGNRLQTLVNFVESRDAGGSLRQVRMTIFNATERRRYERDLLSSQKTAQAAAEENRLLNKSLTARIDEVEAARRRTEELLRQAQKMEAIGQLTGGIAHDFNNLLAGIIGSLEILERRLDQGRLDELSRHVTAARGAAKRAALLTRRLLAFSRRQELEPQATDINRVLGDLEDLLRRSLGASVQLDFIGSVNLWTTMIDRNQVENAVLNLCINARDAMPSGGRVTVATSNKWLDQQVAVELDISPGHYVALCVSDTGTGMTPEVLKQAFDPFFTTKPSGVGTGLGLAMVHGFARQAGGHVRIDTELGKGSTICIYLPRHRGAPEENILIVDEEPTTGRNVG